LFSILFLLAKKKPMKKKHTHDKKLRKTKQQMITDTNKDVYTGTFLDSKAPSIRNVMGLFPDENINLVPKASCDDPKPSLSFCLPIVATCGGRGSPFEFGCHTLSQHCGCALPLRLSICCQRLRKENQSHQHDSKKKLENIYIPDKIAQNWVWQGIATPFTVVMVTD
jgi:hypothetical protein